MDGPRKSSRYDDREDVPMYSRLFITCSKNLKEDDFHRTFEVFGEIQDVHLPCDRQTGQPKGVAFVKFAKTSQAAKAMEAMNHKCILDGGRPIRIRVAANRSEVPVEDNNKYRRIFINVSKSPDENEEFLNSHFKRFGQIEDILIQTDRNTGQRKGFAYIKFMKFSEAAIAVEECDKKYRAIFAQPQNHNQPIETPFESNIKSLASTSNNKGAALLSLMDVNPKGYSSVNFTCNPYLTQPLLESLFDIVPGMVECRYFVDLVRNIGKGTVQFASPISAAYAVEKLNQFEYPPGHCIYVQPGNKKTDNRLQLNIPNAVQNLKNAIATQNSGPPNLAQLTEAIAEASKIVKMATGGVAGHSIPDSNDLNYCSIKLPPTQPLADIDVKVEKRLFLVCKPQPPPQTVLRDVFCRFGNLISVYTLPNKIVGYARYASEQSANEAMKALHGAEVCGVRMKVLEAEEEAPPKRARYDY